MSKPADNTLDANAKSFYPSYLSDIDDNLDSLLTNPGSLEDVVYYLTATFQSFVTDESVISHSVNYMVNKIIKTDNLQYIGALACAQLCEFVLTQDDKKIFRDCLFETLKTTNFKFVEEGFTSKISFNFLYFFTEFLLKYSQVMNDLGIFFSKILTTINNILTQQPTIPSLECVHRVIKMSRLQLCDMCPKEFELLQSNMKEMIVHDSTPTEHRRKLLDTVLLMAVCKESRSKNQVLTDFNELSLQNGSQQDEPPNQMVSYGVHIFNSEDSTYILPNEVVDPEIYEDYDRFVEDLDGMDEQAEAAFEGFLASTHQ